MPKIFISYARDISLGEVLACNIQTQLEDADFNVFRDVTGLKGGDKWLQKLEQELRASELVVLVLSKKVLSSKWVNREIILAEKLNIPVIPIFAELIDLPLSLVDLQPLDFSEQNNWQQLFEAIECQLIVLPQEEGISTMREVISDSSTPPSSKHDSYNPQWASKSGSDHYGQYADLTVGEVSQRFRLIQPDSFWMGSPESEAERESIDIKETRHQVTLSERFWLADTVCTQSFWKVVFGNNPAHFKGNDDNPVEQVNLNDIKEFIETLNSMDSTFSFSLPTEAQWEYACRAGTNTPFSFCENITPEVVSYDGNYPYADGVQGLFRERTVPVKSMPANPWGLYEMNGNVWEYCLDTYQKDLGNLACVDPLNVTGRYAVLRGGSWNSHAKHCRSASRRFAYSSERNVSFGLRLCLVVTA